MQRNVQRVVVTMGDRRGKLQVEKLLKLKASGVYIQDGPEYYESITGKIPLDSLRLSWLLFSPGFHVRTALRFYKRVVFALLSARLAILLTSPLMLLAAIAIRLDSPGPAIFRQKRVGEHGSLFTVFKFRSMYDGSDKKKLTPVEHGDPRVTAVGKWLRRTRIDELPQLFNIVKGDMAFVGPRPFVPEQEEECAARNSVLQRALAGETRRHRMGANQSRLQRDPGRQSREAGLRLVLYQERFLWTRPVHHVLDHQDPVCWGEEDDEPDSRTSEDRFLWYAVFLKYQKDCQVRYMPPDGNCLGAMPGGFKGETSIHEEGS